MLSCQIGSIASCLDPRGRSIASLIPGVLLIRFIASLLALSPWNVGNRYKFFEEWPHSGKSVDFVSISLRGTINGISEEDSTSCFLFTLSIIYSNLDFKGWTLSGWLYFRIRMNGLGPPPPPRTVSTKNNNVGVKHPSYFLSLGFWRLERIDWSFASHIAILVRSIFLHLPVEIRSAGQSRVRGSRWLSR